MVDWKGAGQLRKNPIGADQLEKLQAACKKYNVDEKLLKGILMQESGNNKYANSRPDSWSSGAMGYFQFMPSTFWSVTKGDRNNNTPLGEAQLEFGVQVEAAAKLMRDNLNHYKGHPAQDKLALAAYNAGTGTADNIKKALAKGRSWDDAVSDAVDQSKFKDKEGKKKEIREYPSRALGQAVSYSATREEKSQNTFCVSEGMASIYSAIHDSSIVDLSQTTKSLVIPEGLDNTPWYKQDGLVLGNPSLKNLQPIWFRVQLSPTQYLTDSNGRPVELRLNCSLSDFELSMKHKYTRTQTRTGVHLTLWGMEPDVITGSGSTGVWMNQYGLTQFMSSVKLTPDMQQWLRDQNLPTPGAPGMFDVKGSLTESKFGKWLRDGKPSPGKGASDPQKDNMFRVAAQDDFLELLALFKYNAITRFKKDNYTGTFSDRDQLGANVWSSQYGTSTTVAGARNNDVMYRGSVVMGTKDDIYTGYFKTLSFTEDSEKPYRWNFNFTFQVESKTKFTGVPV